MLRIMEENAPDNSMILRLDGRLVSQWVEVLRTSCEGAFKSRSRLTLDLAGVSFADHEGVQLLQHLEQQQVELLSCSPFLREQLKQRTFGLSPNGIAGE